MTHAPVLTDDELAAYHEHGYVRLGKVAPDYEIKALCRRIDDIMLGKIRYDNMLMQLCPSAGEPELSKQTKVFKGSTLKYRKVQDLEQDPLFLPYIQHPLFRDITRKIIGDDVSAFRTMFFNKPAGQGVPINWHQDGAGGWKLSIPPKVTIWTALDATSVANGCLQIIPGSHKSMIPENGDLLSPEERAIHAPDEKRLYLEMETGEVVLLHNWTLHRSEVNTTDRPRRAFSVCYVDAATYRAPTGQRFPKIFPEYVPLADEF
ncbi:MAG: phytanoyl-CoA dioxygenase family protein [Candidatus Poribacteria bacterium]|nr:phytanoyl-CoA dioxygenase family protein [Candidatus Poribacteria bacterium]MDE0506606.1 phytanoyl-CoA dioxygenase family protein [Candidatus Poribacteria bacterium]